MDREDPVSTTSHWVVVIGYEMDEVPPDQGGRRLGKLILYDNNFPDVESYLTPNFNGWFDHNRTMKKYRTYFPYDGYSDMDPRHRIASPANHPRPRPAQWYPV